MVREEHYLYHPRARLRPFPRCRRPQKNDAFLFTRYRWFTKMDTATPATASSAKATHIQSSTLSLTTLPVPPTARSKRPRIRPLRKKPFVVALNQIGLHLPHCVEKDPDDGSGDWCLRKNGPSFAERRAR